jgi:hypothetical protein
MFLAAVPVSLAMAAGLGGPLAYSINTAATPHAGALPSAGPTVAAGFGPGRFGPGGFGGFGGRFRGAAGGRFPAGAGAAGGAAGVGGSGAGGQAGGGQFPGSGFGGGQGGTGQVPGGSGAGGQAGGQFPGGQGGTGRFPGGFGGRGFGGGGLGGNTQVSSALTTLLTAGAAGYTWAAATVGSESAAPLQLATGKPVLAIGGFNGTDPTPTLAQFERLVSEHKIHYFVGQSRSSFGGGSGAAAEITSWVGAHFTAETVGGVSVYDLTGSAAAS